MRRRTRLAATITAIGVLAGAVVTGGAMAAYADDGLEFDASHENATVPYGPVTFSGTSDEDSVPVSIYFGGEGYVCDAPVIDGSWTCTSDGPIPPGTWTFNAWQFNYEPYVDQLDEITMTVRLPVPFATAPTEIPYGGSMHFTGWNAYPTASIHAEVTDPPGTGLECDTGEIVSFGSWTCAIHTDEEIPPGTTATVTFTQTMAGSDPEVGSLEVYIGQAPPAQVRLDAPGDGDGIVYDPGAFLALNGAAPLTGGLPVSVDIDGTPLCVDAPVDVDGLWDCGTVSVPWDGADTFGPRTITATQGETSDSATIELFVPGPDDDSPYFADEGDSSLWVGGDTGIEGFTIFAQVRDHPEISCSATPWYVGFWDCVLDVSSLPVGTYVVDSHQRPVPDPGDSVQSVISEAVLYIEEPPPPPVIECVFSPGGLRTWSNDPTVAIDVYATHSIGGDEGYTPNAYGACGGRPGNVLDEDVSYELLQSCDPECVLTGLAPGVYNLYYSSVGEGECQECEGEGSTWYDYFFTVPATPSITSVTTPGDKILLSGVGTPGDDLRVDAAGGAVLCTARVNDAGGWSCAFAAASATTARAVDIDFVSRGMSAYSAAVGIPAAPPAPSLPTLPVISWLLDFGGGLDGLLPGDVFTITSQGLPAGTSIEIWMHSTPVLLESTTATGGPMVFTLTVPLDIEPGPHTVELIAVAPDGTLLTHVAPATVAVIPAKSTPGVDEIAEHFGNVKNPPGEPGGDRSDPAAPTALTDAIPTAQRIAENPVAIAIAGGLAIALLFLVALPTELLNASLSSNSSRLGRGFLAVERGMNRARDWLIQVTRSRAIAAAVTVLIVSITFGFIDPAFGFDLASVRLVLSLAIAFFLLSYGASWVSGLIVRRAWGAESVIALQPSIILFAVVGVVVARLLDFSPGFLVGVAIGLELIRASRKAALGAVLVQFGMIVGLALTAWAVYSILALGAPPADFGSALVHDTLVAITAEGLMGALVAVFPLRFLDGRELFDASKWLWAGCFVVVAGAFALLVLPTALEGTEVGDVGVWLLVFAAFGAISIGVWWILARADKRAAAAEQEPERESVDA